MCGIKSSINNSSYIFSIGGITNRGEFVYVYDNNCYDVTSSTWSNKTHIPIKMLQAVCVGIDDILYMFGSVFDHKIVKYNFISDKWTISRQTITTLDGDPINLM
eukprot:270319_1